MYGSIRTATSARLLATMTAEASQLSTMYPASAATRCQLTGVTYAPSRIDAQIDVVEFGLVVEEDRHVVTLAEPTVVEGPSEPSGCVRHLGIGTGHPGGVHHDGRLARVGGGVGQ